MTASGTGPKQTEVVLVTPRGQYEIKLAVGDPSLTLGSLDDGPSGTAVLVDGRTVPQAATFADVRLQRGSEVTICPVPAEDAVASLIVVDGPAAGEMIWLTPGVKKLGIDDVDGRTGVPSGGLASLYVGVEGSVLVRWGPGSDGDSMTPVEWDQVFTVGHNSYALVEARGVPESSGAVPFNRPPRSEFPGTLAALNAPSEPPPEGIPSQFGWVGLLVPLVMGIVLAVVWNPLMAVFALLSPVMLVANHFEERRKSRRGRVRRRSDFAAGIAKFLAEVDCAKASTRQFAWQATPGPSSLILRCVRGDSRLWQRRLHHPDFLRLGVGVGTVAFGPAINPGPTERAACIDEFLESYRWLEDVPVTCELVQGEVVGVVGSRRRAVELARWMMTQAAFHHGPSDLQLIVVTDRPHEWDWVKWLPHLQIGGDSSLLAVGTPGATMDEFLMPILATNDEHAVLDRGAGRRHTLVVSDVADMTAPGFATVRRLLNGQGSEPRCAVVVSDVVESLPAACGSVITVMADGNAVLERPLDRFRSQQFASWRMTTSVARRVARALGRFSDPEVREGGGNLPDVVHLVDLLALGDLDATTVARRWASGGGRPRCRAPIGTTSSGVLWVDWVKDGPHALLAGTTGSGKSELLRSLVASLAITVDPEHLNFVLVDYKGGSAFDACAGLPHTVGLLTDLDNHLARRSLICLEAEVRTREEELRTVGATDLEEYWEKRPRAVLPRLLVVVDEFAALAKELPEFMKALIDIAQRGRSLGVHLLLATQRPNGVVNDDILANTNLRCSLRVQDPADSVDVVGVADAAGLSRTMPGRGYIRRGQGDVVAFQSALVTGRGLSPGAGISVSPFTVLPQIKPIAERAACGSATDLELLLVAVQQAAKDTGMRPTRKPWPDVLPDRLDSDDLAQYLPEGSERSVVLGVFDEPVRQRQRRYGWDMESNLLVYGAQGSGTSNSLRAAIAAACLGCHADELHAYVLDFDDQGLGSLGEFPHVGAVISASERDRQVRLIRYLRREIDRRREDLVSGKGGGVLPRILLAVDNFAGFSSSFDDPRDIDVRDSMGRIIADGPGVGITALVSAKQALDVRPQIAANFSTRLLMRLTDPHEFNVLGVPGIAPPNVVGRCFESGTSREVQLMAVSSSVVMDWAATAVRPARNWPWDITSLPEEVKLPDLVDSCHVSDDVWKVTFALGDRMLEPTGWTFREGDHGLVAGPARSGKSSALVTIAVAIGARCNDLIVSALLPRRSVVEEMPELANNHRDVASLVDHCAQISEGVPHLVLIDDAEHVEDVSGVLADLIAVRHPNLHIVVAGSNDLLRNTYGHWTQGIRRSRLGVALRPDLLADGDLWQTPLPRFGPTSYPPGRGYLVAAGSAELAQVACP